MTGNGRHSVTVEWLKPGERTRQQEYFDVESLDRLIAELQQQGIDTSEVTGERDRLQEKLASRSSP